MSTHTDRCFCRKSGGRWGQGIRLNQVNFMSTSLRARADGTRRAARVEESACEMTMDTVLRRIRRAARVPVDARRAASVLRGSELSHHLVEIEARRPLADREVLEALEPLRDQRLRGHQHERALDLPVAIEERLRPALERIGSQVVDLRHAEARELPLPDAEPRVLLLLERDLPVADADREQVAVVAPV